jgi:hypothetical protein
VHRSIEISEGSGSGDSAIADPPAVIKLIAARNKPDILHARLTNFHNFTYASAQTRLTIQQAGTIIFTWTRARVSGSAISGNSGYPITLEQ